MVHHQRKSDSEDIFDTVHGSTALTGAADTIIILHRKTDGAHLSARGRDIEEYDYAVEFSKGEQRWQLLGDADTARLADTSRQIVDAVGAGHTTPKAVAEATGLEPAATRQSLLRLVEQGHLDKEGRGEYKPAA